MDYEKIGRLILQLRKEKGLTQQQIAEQLCVSNKTISKWECGLGCPDLSLWKQLSSILGADILKLMQGELTPNPPDAGKIERVRFLVCPLCGNILTYTGNASVSCCGRPLNPCSPSACDDEHLPVIEPSDLEHYITLHHPMRKDHYISFAAWVCNDRLSFVRLYPEQSPAFRLPLTGRGGSLYLYCTNHGLFQAVIRNKPGSIV